jgi:DNA adenine methylase
VLRSTFSSQTPAPVARGRSAGVKGQQHSAAHAYHLALDLFARVQERLRFVLIDYRDFAEVIGSYNRPRALFYVDPPYLGHEQYYQTGGSVFSLADHHRLAALLNRTQVYVALSYYPHPFLDDLYPAGKWQHTTWHMPKHSQRTRSRRDIATELLLTNYLPGPLSLWETRSWTESEVSA